MEVFTSVDEKGDSVLVHELVSGYPLRLDGEYYIGDENGLTSIPPDTETKDKIYQKIATPVLQEGISGQEQYHNYFPMAVFGTLKKAYCNTYLMQGYKSHCYGFIPNFRVEGLSIYHEEDHSGICEVFFYDVENWQRIISSVDNLEGFSPYSGGYHYLRTLMNMRLIPENDHRFKDFEEDFTQRKTRSFYHKDNYKGLQIPVDQWDSFIQLPCWIYSNASANTEASIMHTEDPVLFCGHA